MNVYYLAPAKKISRYVESILVIDGHTLKEPFSLPLFANGTPTFLFTTVPGEISDKKSHLTLFGQTVQPARMVMSANFKLFAYFLNPCYLCMLFNIAATELTDQPVAIDLLESGSSHLLEQLLNTTSTSEVIRLIDDYIYSKATARKPDYNAISYAAEKIRNNSNKNILQTTQQELYLTERTFQRSFERQIGISPNLFRRINQFSRAFSQINRQKFPNLSSVAYHNGYADQSHFIRTFKEFTNLTPSQYLNLSQNQ